MAAHVKAAAAGLEQLEAKFFQLLAADRESKEFEALFREVDEALARAVRECGGGLASRAEPAAPEGH